MVGASTDEEQSEEEELDCTGMDSTGMASPAEGLQAVYNNIPCESSDSESTSDSTDGGSPQNLLGQFDDASGFPRRKLGRPVNTVDTQFNQRKRERYLRSKLLRGSTSIKSKAIKPDSARKQKWRQTKTTVEEVRKAFKSGDMKNGLNLLVSVIHSKAAEESFGEIVSVCKDASLEAVVGRNVLSQMGSIGSAHKMAVVRLATSGEQVIDIHRLAALAGLSSKFVQSAAWHSRKAQVPDRLFTEKYAASVQRRNPEKTALDKLIYAFFKYHSQVKSGAKRDTREILMDFNQLEMAFYAEYPKWLRILHVGDPELLQHIQTKDPAKLTRFESSLACAVHEQTAPGFDEEKEQQLRMEHAKQLYNNHLDQKKLLARCVLAVTLTAEAIDEERKRKVAAILLLTETKETTTDPANETDTTANVHAAANSPHTYTMHQPPCQSTFWKTLKKLNVHWTQNFKPTECPIHDEGEMNKIEYAKALESMHLARLEISKLRDRILEAKAQTIDVRDLREQELLTMKKFYEFEGAHRVLRDKVQVYTTHLKQYECCRAVIKKIERNLKVAECVMYRDFVAAYNCEGSKIQNLVLVCLYRDVANGPLKVFKFNNLCDDKDSRSADPAYVADVFEFYFGKNGDPEFKCSFFKQFTRVYISGDHGTHFSSIETMFNESRFKELYGVEFVMFFLCSYHAYNRCDGAGVESKKVSISEAKGRKSLRSASEVQVGLNGSNYSNSIAFNFAKISRNMDQFPKLVKGAKLRLRKMCEVKYTFVNEHGKLSSEEGVILCRLVPSVPGEKGGEKGDAYEVYDLRLEPPGGELCRVCSKEKQHPVRHKDALTCPWVAEILDAKNPQNLGNLKQSMLTAHGPDPSRIFGQQLDKAFQNQRNKPMGTFPCKVLDADGLRCMDGHHYNTISHANGHMKSKHGVKDGDSRLYNATQPSKSEWVCKATNCPNKTGKIGFQSAKNANQHMQTFHSEDHLELYAIAVDDAPAKKRRKAAILVSDPVTDTTDAKAADKVVPIEMPAATAITDAKTALTGIPMSAAAPNAIDTATPATTATTDSKEEVVAASSGIPMPAAAPKATTEITATPATATTDSKGEVVAASSGNVYQDARTARMKANAAELEKLGLNGGILLNCYAKQKKQRDPLAVAAAAELRKQQRVAASSQGTLRSSTRFSSRPLSYADTNSNSEVEVSDDEEMTDEGDEEEEEEVNETSVELLVVFDEKKPDWQVWLGVCVEDGDPPQGMTSLKWFQKHKERYLLGTDVTNVSTECVHVRQTVKLQPFRGRLELKTEDRPTKDEMEKYAVELRAFVLRQAQHLRSLHSKVPDTGANSREWKVLDPKFCVVGHFALLKSEDSVTTAVHIELVKITKPLNADRKFEGTMFLCTRPQTSASCLAGKWHLPQQKKNAELCDADTVVSYFGALTANHNLPAKVQTDAKIVYE
jgi:hypothetical protein